MALGSVWGLFCWIIHMLELRMFESLQMADTTCRTTRSRNSQDSESEINLVRTPKSSSGIILD